jgi:hypothetical protein
MASYLFRLPAGDHARLYGEIRKKGTCQGRSVQAYSEMMTDDKSELRLRVVYEQEHVIREEGMPNLYSAEVAETYVFNAASVEALEGKW